jgi:hypothetical protein
VGNGVPLQATGRFGTRNNKAPEYPDPWLGSEREAMRGKKKVRAEYWMGEVKDGLLQKEHPPSTNYIRDGPPAPSLPLLGRYSAVVELVAGSRSRGLS